MIWVGGTADIAHVAFDGLRTYEPLSKCISHYTQVGELTDHLQEHEEMYMQNAFRLLRLYCSYHSITAPSCTAHWSRIASEDVHAWM